MSTQPVSLWMGNFRSKKDLVRYTQIQYTEHGDSIASPFEKGFQLGYYDRDLAEKYWSGKDPLPLEKLLAGCSCEDQLIPQFSGLAAGKQYNTFLLIFHYAYGGEVISHKYQEGNIMEHIGNTTFTP